MIAREKVTEIVFNAIDEINGQLPQESHLEKSVDTILIGESGTLDSMGFVFLIAATEQRIVEEFGIKVELTSDDSTFSEGGPFQTVGTFIGHIFDTLNKEKAQ